MSRLRSWLLWVIFLLLLVTKIHIILGNIWRRQRNQQWKWMNEGRQWKSEERRQVKRGLKTSFSCPHFFFLYCIECWAEVSEATNQLLMQFLSVILFLLVLLFQLLDPFFLCADSFCTQLNYSIESCLYVARDVILSQEKIGFWWYTQDEVQERQLEWKIQVTLVSF